MLSFRATLGVMILIISLSMIPSNCLEEETAEGHLRADNLTGPQADYREIDRHALNTPDSKAILVDSLASYLIEPAKNDREKARAIYRWVTENIDYDVPALFHSSFGDTSPEGVLKSGKSVCSGYSRLFASLATAAGLDVVTISGYSKGYDYTPGMKFNGTTDHAWNAIKINGSWHLIDSTWGAGSLIDGKYARKFDEHYFLTPPEEFIFGHLPEDPQWQLLEKPISKEEFEDMAYLASDFFNFGFKQVYPLNGSINSNVESNLTLFAPDGVRLMANLERIGENIPSLKTHGEQTLIQRAGENYIIKLLPPSPGEYILTILANRDKESDYYWEVAEYIVKEESGSNRSFPKLFDGFFDLGLRLDDPFNGTIYAKGMANVTLYAPDEVLLIADLEKANQDPSEGEYGSSVFLQRLDEKYIINLLPPEAGEYVLTIYAKRKTDVGTYPAALQYDVLAPSGSSMSFPQAFGDFFKRGAYLSAPLDGELHAGTDTTFAINVPDAIDVAVTCQGTWYYLKKNGNDFQGNITPGKGETDVAARFPGNEDYSTLLRYIAI